MRRVSINGAVFIFMARGEKLKDSDWLPSNGLPDSKYVLWPRGEGWDVRYLVFGAEGVEWLPITKTLFADEAEAWQAAYEHWMNRSKKTAPPKKHDDYQSEFPFCHLEANNFF
ncbi:hypothetical protein [Enterobacter roggenkampii]|uniref:hypothetical protein n=1 Tax=Enterobacter roggenkampii TaxID=1812935 RepID=UPI002FFC941C